MTQGTFRGRECSRRTNSTGTDVHILLVDLKTCGRTRNLERGKQLHVEAKERGDDSDIYVVNALINMYTKCGSMVQARRVFDMMEFPDVVSWTVLIMGYAENGQGLVSLHLLTRMKNEGPTPDCVTLLAALKACTSMGTHAWGWVKKVHNLIVENGFDSDIYIQSTLIDAYVKCGSMVDARQSFESLRNPNLVCWNALLVGYADNGEGLTALEMFSRMRNGGPVPDSVTFLAALKACMSLTLDRASAHAKCKQIHLLTVAGGCYSDIFLQSTLVDMYARCGSMVDARWVFDSIKHPNVVTWTALIMGYAENGQGFTALGIFTKMKNGCLAPDCVTLVAALKACISLLEECREWGKVLHNLAVDDGCDSNIYMQSTLIDMYAKCGSMMDARQVFDAMKHQNVVSWTAMILGYADNEQALTALELFMSMKNGGYAPNSATFLAVLKACGLVGGLEFGRTIHLEIKVEDIEIDVILVTCLVDFYAKCGSLMEARNVFDMHPQTRDVITWTALLGGFSNCGDHESVFALFEGILDAGFQPDSVTFLCVLSCCSHGGFIDKGKECLDTMSSKYGIVPTVEHYSSMVDSFGRVNKLEDAMALLERMPCSPNDITWMTILGACRKWNNLAVGRLAFQSLISRDAAAYVLMGQIYGSKGMLQEQEIVLTMKTTFST